MGRSAYRALGALLIVVLATALAPSGGRQAVAAGYTFVALPVSAVSPANGQVSPLNRPIQIRLATSSSGWTSTLGALFTAGAYGLRLQNAAGGSIVWFIPKGRQYSTGRLSLSTAISFDPKTAVITVQPGPLSPAATYTAVLAAGLALPALIGQDLGYTATTTSLLCCTYPAQGTAPWSFTTASSSATATSGTSTTAAGAATAGSTGTTTNAGVSSLTATGVGIGTVTTAAYASSPVATPPGFTPSGAYFDVYASLANTFQRLTLTFCKSGATLYWYTGSSWLRVSSQIWHNGCLAATISGSSSPSLGQLTGTTFTGALPTVTAISAATGTPSGGNSVLISGSGFMDSSGNPGVQSVSFGGAPVATLPGQTSPSFTVLSDSSLEVWVTPPGAGAVDVTVTTSGGTSLTTAADSFTYGATAARQTVAIPSYIYPTTGDAWSRIDAAAPVAGLTVINPSNGPGASCDASYAAQVQASQAHGIAVLGYVYTKYANTQLDYLVNAAGAYDRTVDAVKADIAQYYTCYPSLDGIFFDEGSTDCSYVASYYGPLSAYVKTRGGRGLTALNPGNQSNECYLAASDILVTFEGSYAGYTAYAPASWASTYPTSRFWHLVYDAPNAGAMQDAVSRAKQHGAGWVYVTDGGSPNPWGALPADPYWTDELQAVQPALPVVTSVAPNNGPLSGGTAVTIRGAHFSNTTQVCFGSTCLSSGFTVAPTRDQLTVTSPAAGAGTVDVTVVTDQGASATASRDQFTYAAPPSAGAAGTLADGDFSSGISGWTENCKDYGGVGYQEGAVCGSFFTASSSGLRMTGKAGGLPYEGVYQVVPASAASTLAGTVTVTSMDACGAAWVAVSVTLLDAHQQQLGTTINNDPMFGNVTFGHHPNVGCVTYVPPNTPTAFYQDMPTWIAGSGPQHFSMDIGSLIAGNLPGIAASQVAYIRVQLTDYADTTSPVVTFSSLTLSSAAPSSTTVSVKDYGAAGNGTTDDTAAFQGALSHLDGAGGGTLYIGPGTYLVQPSTLVLHSNITVTGLGATIRPATGGGAVLLEIQGSNVTLSNITLDGTDSVTRGLNVDATSSNVSIAHDVIANIRQSSDPANTSLYYGAPVGMQIYGNTDRITIDGTTVDNVIADRPECAACSRRVARGIRISPSTGQTIATNVTIQNSAVSNVGPKDDGDCIVAQDSNSTANLTITNNIFDFCHKRAIKVQVPGATVSNNTIENPFLGANFTDPQYGYSQAAFPFDMYAAISVYNSNITVSGNTIAGRGSSYSAVDVGTCSPLNNITVQNNSVGMGSDAYTYGGSLIRLNGPIDTISVTGNTLSNADRGIMELTGLTNLTVSGNTFNNVRTPVMNYAGAC